MRADLNTFIVLIVLAGGLAAARADAADQHPASSKIRLEHCLVSLLEDVDVPAERAGVLRNLAVQEGDYVKKSATLGEIDREQAEAQAAAAKSEADVARGKSESKLEIEHAQVEHEVRLAEHRMSSEANKKEPNSVSIVELERLRLAAEQARLKILVADQERRFRGLESVGFDAKALQTEIDVRARRIVAPISGEVVETFFRPGEWVEPGKPLLRLVRLDRLRVEGFVSFDAVRPSCIKNSEVEAQIRFADGQVEKFSGRVTFVSPLVQPGGEYRFWAEVDNRRVDDEWLLRPGVTAELMIQPRSVPVITTAVLTPQAGEAARD